MRWPVSCNLDSIFNQRFHLLFKPARCFPVFQIRIFFLLLNRANHLRTFFSAMASSTQKAHRWFCGWGFRIEFFFSLTGNELATNNENIFHLCNADFSKREKINLPYCIVLPWMVLRVTIATVAQNALIEWMIEWETAASLE